MTAIVGFPPTGHWHWLTVLQNIWFLGSSPISVRLYEYCRNSTTTDSAWRAFVKHTGWLTVLSVHTTTRVGPHFPICIPSIYFIAVIIHDANIHWLAKRARNYMASHIEVVDSKWLVEEFPDSSKLALHSMPSIVVDQSDNVALWYLPTPVSGSNQVS